MSRVKPFIRAVSLRRLLSGFVIAASLVLAGWTGDARASQKESAPPTGRIEVATTPNGYPLIIDGQPSGETSTTVRQIDLPPGLHTIEIQFPNNTRWVRDFNVIAGKKQCVKLNFRPKTITIPKIAKSPCPYPVNVSAPTSVAEGSIITFSSDVSYGGSAPLSYTWIVNPSSARILSGAGTSTITVDTTGLGRRDVAASLSVDDGSGAPLCRQRAQAATQVLAPTPPPVQARRFDEFPSVAFDDDKARLDNLAIELQNNPGANGYIIVYGGRDSRPGQADRLGARALAYLVAVRDIGANRLTVVNGGYRETDAFELWIVPQGATPPTPTPTVQPGDVRPATRRRRASKE